jgi:hypothetical protein
MLSLLALALAAAEPVAEPPVDNEIEVIGRRLREWRGRWKFSGDAVTCKTKRSTGDKAIDAIGCDAMVQCIAPIAPQFDAIETSKLPKDEMNRRGNALLQEARIGECVAAKREAGIAALAEQRRSKRS